MVEGYSATELIAANENSLKSLGRAIALSNGQFSLVLASCNYQSLQQLMLHQLNISRISTVTLPGNAISLYTTIHSQLTSEEPSALMVLGLESVNVLEDLLSTINHIRDEFRKRHSFPMVFWVNQQVLQKLRRFAPDFTSWAATPIQFEMTTNQLLSLLQKQTNSLFTTVLNPGTNQHPASEIIDHYCNLGQVWQHSYELHFAIKDLQNRGIALDPELNASLEFVFGLDNYVNDRIDLALQHFQESLQFWHQGSGGGQGGQGSNISPPLPLSLSPSPSPPSPHLLRQGVLLFHIGLCYSRIAEIKIGENTNYWNLAKNYFQQCLQLLENAGRLNVVAQFIAHFAEVLQHLQQWEELQAVAEKSLDLHQTYGTHIQLACDYGFLTEVAQKQLNWGKASQFAQAGLFCLAEANNNSDPHQCLFPSLLEQIYQLVLAKALRHLGGKKIANERLKLASQKLDQALESSDYRYDPHRYIRLLRKLRSLYFEEGCYLEAFCIRQKRRSVEQQYGFRAFIGAGRLQPQRHATNPVLASFSNYGSIALEILASGRQRDINRLVGRISRPDQKLTVIHGQSGVGKSSTVTAGLVPALQHRAIGDQLAIPVVLQVYTDWVKELGKALTQAMLQIQGYVNEFNSIPEILEQLQENADNHLIAVLIFDQFEEFLFGCTHHQNEEFDKFLCQCLNIPFVKVIFSLREDYLHRLLDFKHLANLEVINNNLLDKNIRYPLKNFSPEDAKIIIQHLTERSHYHLEPELIDALVEDLSAESGEVRPIELQVVGVQLQDERITTLEQYQQFRPNKLIERYIKEIVKDCGTENERAALFVLYLLTDENKKRLFKTHTELTTELAELEDVEKLDLVLEILVRSGLVVVFPDVPDRYQLIHDYLVDLIRYLQQAETSLQAQLNYLRYQVQQQEAKIFILNSELRKNRQQAKLVDTQPQQGLDLLSELKELRKREEQSRVEIERLVAESEQQKLEAKLAEKEKQTINQVRSNRLLRIALAASITGILVLTVSIGMAISLWREASISASKAASASSEALLALGKDIDALKEGLKAGKKLNSAFFADAETQSEVTTALYQAVYGVRDRERNRLEGHTSDVTSVIFSPDGTAIASASADYTMKLWHPDGKLIHTFKGHSNRVNCVVFSPDGRFLASGSGDKTVKIWSVEGALIATLSSHTGVVNSVSFSPDGRFLASSSADKTVKIWSRSGKLLNTLSGHKDAVTHVAWSPDGSILASASSDKTVKLWSQQGKLLSTLSAHKDAVLGVAWSPDGSMLASASWDGTIKLWSREGKLLNTLRGHRDGVTSVTFSPDGSTIASGSIDKTVKLWNLDGVQLETLNGHADLVNDISFSSDGRTLASASRDTTIKLWRWKDGLLRKFQAHSGEVTSVSFSADGMLFATASQDKTVKIWSQDDRLLYTLTAHQGEVWDVSFSPDAKTLASGSKDKTVKLWSRDGELINTLTGHGDVVLSVAWSPDGNVIASGSKDKTVKLWSRDGKLLQTLQGHTEAVNWVSFSPDGQFLASASDDDTVKLWNRDGKLLHTLEGHTRPVYGVAWSPDSSTIASASIDGTVRLWNRDGQLVKKISGNDNRFINISFSPDGNTIAATSDDKVHLWNRDGTLLITLKAHQEEFSSISFSPDGKTLVSGTTEGTVIFRNLQDMTVKNLLSRGCDLLQDYLSNNSQVTQSDRALCQ